jgi:dihydropyrimidinase
VLLDPSVRKKLAVSDLHAVDHSVWEGWDIHAWPSMTILRGKVIVENGQLVGDLSDGQLVGNRKTASAILSGPGC